jgi:hypothetical protein
VDISDIANLVAKSAKAKIDLANARLRPEHHYASLPLCIFDAVFSIAAKYEAVTKPTVIRFANAQTPPWPLYGRGISKEHSVLDAIKATASYSDEELAEEVFKNRQRTSTRNGILKAGACRLFAKTLYASGINRFAEITDDRISKAEIEIKKIPGQNISFDYFTLLAGAQMVKPDRMIIRFVAEAAGMPIVTASVAKEATIRAAAILSKEFSQVDTRLLDSELWSYESLKSANRPRARKAITGKPS